MYFNPQDVITSEIHLGYDSSIETEKTFHIAYGVDKNFLYGTGISIASIFLNNPELDCHFHVFTDYFDDEQKQLFESLAFQYSSRISVYLIDNEKLKTLPSTKNWSYATYFRFIIADYFSPRINRILYLDADIMCKGDIKTLRGITFPNYEVAAVVVERDQNWWHKRAMALGIPSIAQGYFNAGFLYINLSQWAEADISSQVMKLLEQEEIRQKLAFLDQDLLNIVLTKRVVYVEGKYNTQYSLNYELNNKKESMITSDTIFAHYIGPTKPWHEWACYESAKPFSDARVASPWNCLPLLKAKSAHHLRYCAKHRLHQKQYLKGTQYYIAYFFKKIFTFL